MTERPRSTATPEPEGRRAGPEPLAPFPPPGGQPYRRSDARRAPAGRRLASAPSEGWLTLVLLAVMGATFGLSLDDARWVLGRDGLTDFLPFAVVGGVVWGFVAAKAQWSRWRAHFFGALFAALLVPLAVGASLVDHVSLRDWYVATANSTVEAYLDVGWRGRTLTQQYGHLVLLMGLLCWATGQYAGYAAFAHRRAMNSVLLLGVALVANMSITIRDQLPYLVIFSLAALFFLIRLHAAEERASWIRRRIGDPRVLSGSYLRGGVAFVTAAVLGSLVLTSTASSAPLASVWTGIDQSLIGIGQTLQRYFPAGGPGTRITGIAFGQSSAITGRWVTDSTPALSIGVPANDEHVYYWRAIAYDRFDLSGWSLSSSASTVIDGGTAVLEGTLEGDTSTAVTRAVQFVVTPLAYRGTTVFSPYAPGSVDRAARLSLLGGQYFSTLDLTSAGPYTVTAQIPATSLENPDGLTENKLRVAGRDYPADLRAFYSGLPAAAVGPQLRALRDTILGLLPTDDPTPYDLARATTAYLRSDVFTYSTDVTDINCGDRSVAECFAEFRAGYCQHYATTMAVLMRMQGIPARLVQGFLPGERDAAGLETVRYSNSHAWVEVYFP
ncbi:MAG: transglutaminase domain-containing protein, partial [Chloroflexi bacterium]|nr:transglutaminase domain-containing protein [Chloroflexota bacterium]